MEVEKFSDSLSEYTGAIKSPALQDSLSFLMANGGSKILEWSTTRIAIPISIKVDLPTLGNYQEIDIRANEPIFIVFDVQNYPNEAPIVFTDRIDFPKDKLAHLYIAVAGRTPAFCYVRGNSNEWYANKRIQDLLIRISNWLRDAATGELALDGNQFDPLRLEGYSGTIVYDYDLMILPVKFNIPLIATQNWNLGLFEKIKDSELRSYKFSKIITQGNLKEVSEEFEIEKKKDDDRDDKKHLSCGYLLWNTTDTTFENYEIDFPNNWKDFKAFCNSYGINCEEVESIISTSKVNQNIYFPVIIAIKRPSPIYGFTSNIEFVNFEFKIDENDVSGGKINDNIPIKLLAHNQPLTQTKAKEISGSESVPKSVVFGCGALGSKIIMHFARSGETAFTLVDPDHLSPHNLVRHALLSEDVGKNKALALYESIKKLYPTESLSISNATSFIDSAFESPETFKEYQWLFDFTASEAFFNKLVTNNHLTHSQICSVNISDLGNLGILFKEGAARNPRIDDLQVMLYGQYKTNQDIKKWLIREHNSSQSSQIVNVGIGCNSETTILSDIKISTHSSFFAGAIKNEANRVNPKGKIILNYILEGTEYDVKTQTIEIEPLDVLPAKNDSTWSIRYKKGVLDKIKLESKKAKKNETGGIFIGVANYKTKTIHVVDTLAAPPDSKANSICFYRGHEGLPEQIGKISTESGGQLGYIGEWHSHPHGPNGLSEVDMESIRKFKSEFSQLVTPLPVFLTLVAPKGILPFVF